MAIGQQQQGLRQRLEQRTNKPNDYQTYNVYSPTVTPNHLFCEVPNIYAFVCQLIAQTLIQKQEFNLTDQIVLQYAGHTWAHARCTSR